MEIARFLLFRSVGSQLAARTVNKAMSDASGAFAADLLRGRGITCQAEKGCEERGIGEDLTPFVCMDERNEGWE